ncbi:argonaute-like protein [Mycena latifolia]|nr:argonaute-like protein [Mycena latifolia]
MRTRGRGRSAGRGERGEGGQSEGSAPHPRRGGDAPRGRRGDSRSRSFGRGRSPQSAAASSHGGGDGSSRGSSHGRGEGSSASRSWRGSPTPAPQRPTRGRTQTEVGFTVTVNAFPTKVVPKTVYQYDGTNFDIAVVTPTSFAGKMKPSTAVNMRLISRIQDEEAEVFTPRAVYDGQRKLFALCDLDFGSIGSKRWNMVLDTIGYEIRVMRVGQPIDTSILHRFVQGSQSQDSSVTDARQALDIALRMTPLTTLKIGDKHRRTFYPPIIARSEEDKENGIKSIGLGVVLCRGYFQSLRPAPSRLLVNVDICTRAVYRAGRLLDLAREFLKPNARSTLTKKLNSDEDKQEFARFITGVRVQWSIPGARPTIMARTIKGLSDRPANQESFTRRDGRTATIADYFSQVLNRPIEFPGLPSVQVGRPDAGRGALVPMELCTVLPDQPLRTNLPDKLSSEHFKFSAQPPKDRLRLIGEEGLKILGYEQSDYVRQFGVEIGTSAISANARVLAAPVLRYRNPGNQEATTTVRPQNGQWTMTGRHFYRPATIYSWGLVCFNFDSRTALDFVSSLVKAWRATGIEVVRAEPVFKMYLDSRLDILKQLNEAEQQCVEESGKPPSLLFVVLPKDNPNETYNTVKNWGDVLRGIPTQFMLQKTCSKSDQIKSDEAKAGESRAQAEAKAKAEAKAQAKWDQIWLNVAHKVNAKLGGINTILDSVPLLGDPQDGTMIMGADVAHPKTGTSTQGSCAAVVSSVDAHASKYAVTMRVQKGGQEMISDLGDMTAHLLEVYMRYRRQNENIRSNAAPKRIIFYRDGVSDGQFQTSVQEELTQIQAVCQSLKIRPKITFIVVVKRHHMRFFQGQKEQERNCVAGTIIDQDVVLPTEFNFFLQSHSHGGNYGTSRPAHYSVLHDENRLSPDTIQALTFALCHVYTRFTRAVSIPAPVYCTLIIFCSQVSGSLPRHQMQTASAPAVQYISVPRRREGRWRGRVWLLRPPRTISRGNRKRSRYYTLRSRTLCFLPNVSLKMN